MNGQGIRLALALLILLGYLTIATDLRAQARTATEHQTITVEYFLENSCTGNPIIVSGEALLISHITFDAHGGMHSHFEITFLNLSAVDPISNVEYTAVGGQRANFYRDADQAPFILIGTSTTNLISQGATDNLLIHSTYHFGVNANGEVVAFVDTVHVECAG